MSQGHHSHGSRAPNALPAQDLTEEGLLLKAVRNADGRPVMGGIPLTAKLGQGGMGAVYYGIHPRLNMEVAVKVLPFHLADKSPDMIRRFFGEAQIAARVQSENIVRVLDVNEESGVYFLVMEFVRGMSAAGVLKALQKKEPVPGVTVAQTAVGAGGASGDAAVSRPALALALESALPIIAGATRGLAAAHAQDIVHRDIKPDNIMIPRGTQKDPTGVAPLQLPTAKLADLGLAKQDDSTSMGTLSQMAMGTPGYMAPEQVRDAKRATKRSDVFSMGATWYALLAGRMPFSGTGVGDILIKTVSAPHDDLKQIRPDLPPAVLALIDRCLDKDPDKRPADGAELLALLQALPTGVGAAGVVLPVATAAAATPWPADGLRPGLTGPTSPAAVNAGAARKSSRLGLWLLIALLLLLLGGGAGLWIWLQNTRAEQNYVWLIRDGDQTVLKAETEYQAGRMTAERYGLDLENAINEYGAAAVLFPGREEAVTRKQETAARLSAFRNKQAAQAQAQADLRTRQERELNVHLLAAQVALDRAQVAEDLARRKEDLTAAMNAYDRALALRPDEAHLKVKRAQVSARLMDLDLYVESMAAGAEELDRFSRAMDAQELQQAADLAVKHFRKAQELGGGAEADRQRAAAQTRVKCAAECTAGLALAKEGDPEAAGKRFAAAAALDPACALANYQWGLMLLETQLGADPLSWERAQEIAAKFDAATQTQSQYARAWLAWGRLLENSDGPADAGDEFEPGVLAAGKYRQATKADGSLTEAWQRLGQVELAWDQGPQAVYAFQRAVNLEPTNAELACQLGAAFANLQCPAQALPYFAKAAELDDQYVSAWAGRVQALIDLRRFEEADNVAQVGLEVLPEEVELQKLADTAGQLAADQQASDARRQAAQAKLADGDQSAAAVLEYARELILSREWVAAGTFLQEAVKTQTESAELWAELAGCQAEQNHYRDALTNYKKAQALDPDNSNYPNRIKEVEDLRQWIHLDPEDIEALEKQVADEPDQPALSTRLAGMYLQIGDYDKAADLARQGLERWPEAWELWRVRYACDEARLRD